MERDNALLALQITRQTSALKTTSGGTIKTAREMHDTEPASAVVPRSQASQEVLPACDADGVSAERRGRLMQKTPTGESIWRSVSEREREREREGERERARESECECERERERESERAREGERERGGRVCMHVCFLVLDLVFGLDVYAWDRASGFREPVRQEEAGAEKATRSQRWRKARNM